MNNILKISDVLAGVWCKAAESYAIFSEGDILRLADDKCPWPSRVIVEYPTPNKNPELWQTALYSVGKDMRVIMLGGNDARTPAGM